MNLKQYGIFEIKAGQSERYPTQVASGKTFDSLDEACKKLFELCPVCVGDNKWYFLNADVMADNRESYDEDDDILIKFEGLFKELKNPNEGAFFQENSDRIIMNYGDASFSYDGTSYFVAEVSEKGDFIYKK